MTENTKGPNFKYVGIVGLALLGIVVIPFLVDASGKNTAIDQAVIQSMQNAQAVQNIQPLTKDVVNVVTPVEQEMLELTEAEEMQVIAPAAGEEETATSDKNTEDATDDAVEKIEVDLNKTDYNTVLSFPITEEKIKAFVIAADKIDQVNRKWDMLISGAESDTMAVEYITLSSEEMASVMESISAITVDQYNEIFEYATKDREFKNIVNAFKQYYVIAPRKKRNQALSSETSTN